MLVLSRKVDESIWIGDQIRITIVKVDKRGIIGIGIEAPGNIKVFREEIYLQIQAERSDTEGDQP